MEYAVVMAGFGGQGILLMGDLLAFCIMESGLHVTWMPSYGVEMRGGAANCTVIISKESIGVPLSGSPQAVIVMSEPAYERFKNRPAAGGLLMINSSFVPEPAPADLRTDLAVVLVPTQELSAETGHENMANLVMLGAFLAQSKLLAAGEVADLVTAFLPPEKAGLASAFKKALLKGEEYINSL